MIRLSVLQAADPRWEQPNMSTEMRLLGTDSMAIVSACWWVIGLRGLCAAGFAVLLLCEIGRGLNGIIGLFASYLLVDGALALGLAVLAARHQQHWLSLGFESAFNAAAAIMILSMPTLTPILVVYTTALWAIVSGAALLLASAHFGMGVWLMALAAGSSILLGCFFMMVPVGGTFVITAWLGIYALVFATTLLGLSWNLRRLSGA
jgi:uncharacterized membrane protein HdeD (DUF308 family)